MAFRKIQLMAQIVGLVTILVLSVLGVLALASGNNPASEALGPATLSGVPNVINYQGVLRLPDGTPVNGTYSMTFKLYNEPEADSLLHTETLSEVVVHDGLFTVLLGDADGNPIDATAFQNRLYVGIQVGNDAEMAPRQRIAPVPYAVQLTNGIYVDEDGNVGIGTTSPDASLHVLGNAVVQNLDASLGVITMTRTYQVYHEFAALGGEETEPLGQWDLCAILSFRVTGEGDAFDDEGYCRISFDANSDNGFGDQGPISKEGSEQANWFLQVGADFEVDRVDCEAICINLGD